MKKQKVLIVSSMHKSAEMRGGVNSYITNQINSGLNEDFIFIPFMIYFSSEEFFKRFLVSLRYIIKYLFVMSKKDIKIVHVHTGSYRGFFEKSLFLIIAKLFLKRTIIHIHGAEFDKFYEKSNGLTKCLIKFFLSRPDRVIALSEYWYNFLSKIIPSKKIVIVNNCVDVKSYQIKLDASVLNKFNIPSNKNIVLEVGELSKRKGIFELVEAMRLLRTDKETIAIILGEGKERFRLESLIRRYKLDNVCLLGHISGNEKIAFYQSAKIFTLPSHAEGLPIALLEAMASGLPIISTPVGGIPEALTEGKGGFLIAPGDYAALAKKIQILIKDKRLRNNMGEFNLKRANESYSLNSLRTNIKEIYNKLNAN